MYFEYKMFTMYCRGIVLLILNFLVLEYRWVGKSLVWLTPPKLFHNTIVQVTLYATCMWEEQTRIKLRAASTGYRERFHLERLTPSTCRKIAYQKCNAICKCIVNKDINDAHIEKLLRYCVENGILKWTMARFTMEISENPSQGYIG